MTNPVDIEIIVSPILDPQEDKTTPWCICAASFAVVIFLAQLMRGVLS